MGYTHYWKMKSEPTRAQWSRFVVLARAIARKAGVPLAGWDGKGRPVMTDREVAFNGRAPEDFESFRIRRGVTDFDFCKTGRRPYDTAVVAVLSAAVATLPGFEWSSDGGDDDHAAGRELCGLAIREVCP